MGSIIIVKGNKQEIQYKTCINKLSLDDELCIYAIADFALKNGVPYPNCEIRQKVDIGGLHLIDLDELAKN